MEHPDITRYNQYGYLPDDKRYINEEDRVMVAHCKVCDDTIYEDNTKAIKWDDFHFCNKECLEEAYREHLLETNNLRECF